MINVDHLTLGMQDPREIRWLLERVAGVRSILEVGSAEGKTLQMFAHVAMPGAKIRSIDVAENQYCVQVMDDLRQQGFDVEQKIANSMSPEAIAFARENGPFELIFIDADHGPSVFSDWLNYGPMATRFLAFHDISVPHVCVRQLWTETIVPHFNTEEILIDPQFYGIGLVKLKGARQNESTSPGVQLAIDQDRGSGVHP